MTTNPLIPPPSGFDRGQRFNGSFLKASHSFFRFSNLQWISAFTKVPSICCSLYFFFNFGRWALCGFNVQRTMKMKAIGIAVSRTDGYMLFNLRSNGPGDQIGDNVSTRDSWYLLLSVLDSVTNSYLKVPWHQKNLISNMMKNGVYSTKKLKLYMYYKYLWVKWLKLSNCAQIMLFVGL